MASLRTPSKSELRSDSDILSAVRRDAIVAIMCWAVSVACVLIFGCLNTSMALTISSWVILCASAVVVIAMLSFLSVNFPTSYLTQEAVDHNYNNCRRDLPIYILS